MKRRERRFAFGAAGAWAAAFLGFIACLTAAPVLAAKDTIVIAIPDDRPRS